MRAGRGTCRPYASPSPSRAVTLLWRFPRAVPDLGLFVGLLLASSLASSHRLRLPLGHEFVDAVGLLRHRLRRALPPRHRPDDGGRGHERLVQVHGGGAAGPEQEEPARPRGLQRRGAGADDASRRRRRARVRAHPVDAAAGTWPQPMVAGALAYYLVNTVLVAAAIALSARRAPVEGMGVELPVDRAELFRGRGRGGGRGGHLERRPWLAAAAGPRPGVPHVPVLRDLRGPPGVGSTPQPGSDAPPQRRRDGAWRRTTVGAAVRTGRRRFERRALGLGHARGGALLLRAVEADAGAARHRPRSTRSSSGWRWSTPTIGRDWRPRSTRTSAARPRTSSTRYRACHVRRPDALDAMPRYRGARRRAASPSGWPGRRPTSPSGGVFRTRWRPPRATII